MKRVLISVEGQTEETFVQEILANHLRNYNVTPIPVVVATKVIKQGNKFKGGLNSYIQVRNDICKLLQDTSVTAVTTMYDLYHLPTDFPGYATRPPGNGAVKAVHLEAEFQQQIAHPRFRAYLQVHEFEALLFTSPEVIARMFPGTNRLPELMQIRQTFNSPEDINEGATTAPSKRILNLFPNYDKPLDGALIAIEIGVDRMRAECLHFNNWLTWLEGL